LDPEEEKKIGVAWGWGCGWGFDKDFMGSEISFKQLLATGLNCIE
jgi:hypothetical protein